MTRPDLERRHGDSAAGRVRTPFGIAAVRGTAPRLRGARRASERRALRCFAALLGAMAASGCSDPCRDLMGPPSITIGGADFAGDHFEAYESGGERDLVSGAQGGMHVWLDVRTRGLCPGGLVLERQVIDETGAPRDTGRGVPPFDETDDPDVFELREPTPMFLCPSGDSSPVGRLLSVTVTATDQDGRRVTASHDFVPRCRPEDDCTVFCGDP